MKFALRVFDVCIFGCYVINMLYADTQKQIVNLPFYLPLLRLPLPPPFIILPLECTPILPKPMPLRMMVLMCAGSSSFTVAPEGDVLSLPLLHGGGNDLRAL